MRRIAARARLIRRGVHVHGSRAFSSYLPSRRISSAEVPTLLLLGSGAALLTTLGRMNITQRGQAESSGAIEEPDPPLGAEDADPEAEEADEEGSLQVSGGCLEDVYDMGEVLGRGHFAVVNKGRHRVTGEHVAIKTIKKGSTNVRRRLSRGPESGLRHRAPLPRPVEPTVWAAAMPLPGKLHGSCKPGDGRANGFAPPPRRRWRLQVRSEVEILRRVGSHPNIVALKDVFETEQEWLIVMELVTGGELFERLVHTPVQSQQRLSPQPQRAPPPSLRAAPNGGSEGADRATASPPRRCGGLGACRGLRSPGTSERRPRGPGPAGAAGRVLREGGVGADAADRHGDRLPALAGRVPPRS